jgi:hypothetical protein
MPAKLLTRPRGLLSGTGLANEALTSLASRARNLTEVISGRALSSFSRPQHLQDISSRPIVLSNGILPVIRLGGIYK